MKPDRNSLLRLTVEGVDDKFALIQLMIAHGHDWERPDRPIFVEDAKGVGPLLETMLPTLLSGYTHISYVLDADGATGPRWQSVRDRLVACGYDVPDAPVRGGSVLETVGMPRLGVWLMPDNDATGTLEHFLAGLIAPEDPVWAHAGEATRHARELNARLPERDVPKGQMHAWLAWQETPGLPYGTALRAGWFDAHAALAVEFVEWMRRLFDLPGR
jgi:hypothetical protein